MQVLELKSFFLREIKKISFILNKVQVLNAQWNNKQKKKNKKWKKASQEKRSMSWKPERAIRAKINQWRVSTEKWRFRLGKIAIKKIFRRIQRRLLMAHCENHLEINLIREPRCSLVWIYCSHFHNFLIFTPPCMLEPYSFSKINHYFLFFETLLEIHNWAFMHYCKRFRGQWKNS